MDQETIDSSPGESPAASGEHGLAGSRPPYARASFAQPAPVASKLLPWIGAAAAFFAAVLAYRVVYRAFTWVFAVSVGEVLPWLGSLVLLLAALYLANRLWVRWRLVFSLSLAFFCLWTVGVSIPRLHAVASQPRWGGSFERFEFVQTQATRTTAILLLVVAVVLLFGDFFLAWFRTRSAR